MTAHARCGGCPHTAHAGPCRRRGPSKCVTYSTPDGGTVTVCGYRPPCPCPLRTCKCGLALAAAVELPAGTTVPPSGEVVAVSVARGSAGQVGGRLAVWRLAGGMLACRDLSDGEEPGPGEHRGTEHDEAACGYDLRLVAS